MFLQLPAEEKFNVTTHLFGVLIGLVGWGIFMRAGAEWPVHVFSVSFILLFASSTIYHWEVDGSKKKKWRIADHVSIFVLIAGTYTPFLITYSSGRIAAVLLAILWGLVLVGGILKIFFTGRFKVLSTIIYLLMGWIGIFAFNDFVDTVPDLVLMWIGIGGVGYTLGVVFYLWKGLKYHHGIWHLFVLAGAASHWVAVWLSV